MSASLAGGPVAARIPASAAATFALDRPAEEVTSADRLSFTFFLAAALHIAVILGVGFVLPDPPQAMRSLEVTLAQFRSETPPDDADFLAQADQQGSGSLDEVRELTTDRDAPLQDTRVTDARVPAPMPAAREPQPAPRLAADRPADATVTDAGRPAPSTEAREFDSARVLQQALDLASLDARRANEVQVDAKGRRIRRLTSVSTRTAVEAAYLQSWRRKVETIGNLNYPAEARRMNLEGDLQVLVEIDAAGTLLNVRILESSGSDVLDQSALRIVRLAAPFLPFPDDLKTEIDVLHIVRTWQFRRRGFESG
ncbi:MAG TPA: energy transducer TonB [Pseudomonadales bacterium]|nr:energy transducer TonB [Pseudomonadales bacterium]